MMTNNFMANVHEFSLGLPFLGIGFGVFALGAFLFFILTIAVIILKGYALWHAAKRDEKGWFVALLLINTMGILELVYLYFVVDLWNKKKSNIENDKVPEDKVNEPK